MNFIVFDANYGIIIQKRYAVYTYIYRYISLRSVTNSYFEKYLYPFTARPNGKFVTLVVCVGMFLLLTYQET